jgi:hypothetical protein
MSDFMTAAFDLILVNFRFFCDIIMNNSSV